MHTDALITSFASVCCIRIFCGCMQDYVWYYTYSCNRYKERAEARKRLMTSKSLETRRTSVESMIEARRHQSVEGMIEARRYQSVEGTGFAGQKNVEVVSEAGIAAMERRKTAEDQNRFMHYYNRYDNHLQSIKVCLQTQHFHIEMPVYVHRLSRNY